MEHIALMATELVVYDLEDVLTFLHHNIFNQILANVSSYLKFYP